MKTGAGTSLGSASVAGLYTLAYPPSMLGTSNLVGFVPTSDFDAARPFFRDVLGLKLVAEDPFAITFDANGTTLRVPQTPEFTPQPFTILGWWVDDIGATADALAAAGVPLERYDQLEHDEQGLWSPPGARVKVGWFKDPAGNTLSVTGFVG